MRRSFPGNSTIALAILACLLWSTAFAGVKIGLRYATPLSFAGQRFMLAGLMLAPFWWGRGAAGRLLRRHLKTVLLVAFFQTFLLYGLFYPGMTLVSGALAAIIVGASPLVAAIVAHFSMDNDAMTLPKTLSLGIGMGGVVLISVSRLPWVAPTGWAEFVGIMLLLASTFASIYGNILVARERHSLDPTMLNSMQLFIGGLVLFGVSLPVEGAPNLALPLEYYAVLLWLAALSAIAFSLWFALLKRPGVVVSQLNLWKFIIPVCGALFSWLVLPDESPRLVPVLGMLCIAGAIVLYHFAGRGGLRLGS